MDRYEKRATEGQKASSEETRGMSGGSGSRGSENSSDSKTASRLAKNRLPIPSLPKGGGAIRGMGEKFAANPVTGGGSTSVPIPVSPGRSGFAPALSLSYDSGSGNGPFGFGWSLSLPRITRKTEKGLPRYFDREESDVFLISGAEDLVPVLDGEGKRVEDTESVPGFIIHPYRPRIEGLFARIERWTNRSNREVHWRSIDRDNVTTIYGRDSQSRIFDPENPPHIFEWLIRESYDDKGNAIVYEYAEENDAQVDRRRVSEINRLRTANRYLKRIKYGNKVSRLIQADLNEQNWLFEIVFDYGEGHVEELPLDPLPANEQHRFVHASPEAVGTWPERPDPFSTYRSGFEIRTHRRCHRILMFHRFEEIGPAPYLVRSVDFDYRDFSDSRDLRATRSIPADEELAHQGSTRFASFIQQVTQSGYVRDDDGDPTRYLRQSLPPLEFEYSKAKIQNEIRTLDEESHANAPLGVDGAIYQWVDLDGEGLSGILTRQGGAWHYKPNLGNGKFGSIQTLRTQPSLYANPSPGGVEQLMDLDGDGQIDLVSFSGPARGFYERTSGDNDGDKTGWKPFQSFRQIPNIRWDDPNLRFVDLDGDGLADIMITQCDSIVWYPSRGAEGFDPAQKVWCQGTKDDEGPRLVFADGTESIYLADMTGDGLADLVRVRNSNVCYWPNLGYGRFGAKVLMEGSPLFDYPDCFHQRRIRLADVDGSGTADLIYLRGHVAHVYFNHSGNGFSKAREVPFPDVYDLRSVAVMDLLGNGTSCLVWSSPLPAHRRRPLRYVDLMGGQKPHLLIRTTNNLGVEARIHYASSTKFYLADKRARKPWITRVPFPVHVVERVETIDHVSQSRFVTRYRYHHGFYDGEEREFRGFGMVEQEDTETFACFAVNGGMSTDAASHVPPVLTKTWFHTGVFIDRQRISDCFAKEYFEPTVDLLPDTILPKGLTAHESREACRALKGMMLRQEVYALDGSAKEKFPYAVTEQNFTIQKLQPKGKNRHAVFFTHPREALSFQYERDPTDPRTTHAMTLEVDDFGNVLKSVAIAYGRRSASTDFALTADDRAKQSALHITFTENSFTQNQLTSDQHAHHHRAPLPAESKTFELTGFEPASGAHRFSFDEMLNAQPQRRLIEHVHTLYRKDDLTALCALGEVESQALPGESYQLALTPSLIAEVFDDRISDPQSLLEGQGADRGGYVEIDGAWWIPSGRVFFNDTETITANELVFATQHFFTLRRAIDAFGQTSTIEFDAHDLLMTQSMDAVGNAVSIENDYRVLQPREITDPNGNRVEVSFDALGLVVATAIKGKVSEALGDQLEGFSPNLTLAELQQFAADPNTQAPGLLGNATTRVVYDLERFRRDAQPPLAATLARETHFEPAQNGQTRIQIGFTYSDGFDREIQTKVQAEPGDAPQRDAVTGELIRDPNGVIVRAHTSTRWVGTGRTIFNNKGKPVRQYEPFFSSTHLYEPECELTDTGVSPVLFYDPVERVIAMLHPNQTYEKVVFDAWHQATHDVNDTVTLDPRTDPDIAGYVAEFFKTQPTNWESWLAQRINGAKGTAEQDAAQKAALHAQTPTVAHVDSLGRTFLTLADNGGDEPFATRVELDIEGNLRAVIDAKDRVVKRNDFDLLGKPDPPRQHGSRRSLGAQRRGRQSDSRVGQSRICAAHHLRRAPPTDRPLCR